jgi:hypothetical protein
MASEKMVYWIAVSVLALAAANGFVSEYRGSATRLADKSIAMVDQASEMAAFYTDLATPSEKDDLSRAVCAQVRLARLQSNLARHQAEMVVAQMGGLRVRLQGQAIPAEIGCPRVNIVRPNIVIDLPRPPEPAQILEDARF